MAAQNLFEFNTQNGMIQLNRVWISMVPEFKEILVKSKPVKGDNDGRKKLHAQRVFTFIYLLTDFKSPLRDMQESEKLGEALRCSELTSSDIDEKVKKALEVYEWYQENSARSLRTLKSMRKSLNQLDKYFEDIDFTKTDKKGELLHSAKEYLANMAGVEKAYDSYEKFEERVHTQLTEAVTVRGDRKLGGKEGKRQGWEEGKRPTDTGTDYHALVTELFGGTAFADKDSVLHDTNIPDFDDDDVLEEPDDE
jgi:hypothetical protein